jgi:methylated-DNA-[protein]-cysteine S-methyltransferase
MEYIYKMQSPVGALTVSSDGVNILGLWIEGQKYFSATLGGEFLERRLPIFVEVERWLEKYFLGKEPDFMPSLAPQGSAFQKTIWNILCKIPYGQTTTYSEIAKQYELQNKNKRTSARATGNAISHNPISILIPCHRVIGKNGDLTGYAGGLDIKRKFLQIEKINETYSIKDFRI